MHVTAALALSAGAIKYILPASDTSCVVTHRIMLVHLLLYDVRLTLLPCGLDSYGSYCPPRPEVGVASSMLCVD